MKTIYKLISRSLLIIGTVLILLSGCTVMEQFTNLNGGIEKPAVDPEVAQMAEAEAAFFSDDLGRAEELFSAIATTSEKAVYQNQARYALACIAIIQSQNSDEFKAAVAKLEQWQPPGVEVKGFIENPRMISLALNRRLDLLECEPEIRYVTSKKDGAIVKKQQQEIQDLKNTIKKLQHQISVLETIDQELQEKRKPL